MIRTLLTLGLLAFALPAGADDLSDQYFGIEKDAQDIFITVYAADPAQDAHCAVRLRQDGTVTIGQGGLGRFADPQMLTRTASDTERGQFQALAKEFRAGRFFPPVSKQEGYPDAFRKRPYMTIGLSERRRTILSVSFKVVLPGTEPPGPLSAFIEPLIGGPCQPLS